MEAGARFETVYEATFPSVSRFVVSRLRDRNAAEDILQDVYSAYYQRLLARGDTDVVDPEAYLIRAAGSRTKRWISELIRQRLRLPLFSPSNDEDVGKADRMMNEFVAQVELPEDMLVDRLLLSEIWLRVQKEGKLTASLFLLHFHYGLTIRESAKQLGISQANATNRIYRALSRIRKVLVTEEIDKQKRIDRKGVGIHGVRRIDSEGIG